MFSFMRLVTKQGNVCLSGMDKETITKKRCFREPHVPFVKKKEEELDLPIPVPSKPHPANRALCLLDFSALKKDSASIFVEHTLHVATI